MDVHRLAELLDAAPIDDRNALGSAALAEVGYPSKDHALPLPEDLTPEQRAVAEVLAPRSDVSVGIWAMPRFSWSRLRWLGLSPPGIFERRLPFADGARTHVPLWRALTVLGERDPEEMRFFVRALELSLVDRLDAYVDQSLCAYTLRDLAIAPDFATIGADLGAWSTMQADRILAMNAEGRAAKPDHVSRELRTTILLAIVRAGIPVEPRWDYYIEPPLGLPEPALEILRNIPAARRNEAIVTLFTRRIDKYPLRVALELLASFPSAELTRTILAASRTDHIPKRQILAQVGAIAKREEVVRRELEAYRAGQPKPIRLRTTRIFFPHGAADLSAMERAQLTEMLRIYSGEDRPLDQRFAEDPDFIRDNLQIREMVDGRGRPAFESFSWQADDGCVFEAGTTDPVAHLVQHSIQCEDPRLADALKEALAETKARPRTTQRP